ncbi:MAG: hypothetical protein IPO31_10945 [Candidatus Obscuribacter sp.]|nr:hypothetical protein [Candidatus Obscuribacter sp.]
MQANASGTGNGGIVRFTTTGTTSDLTVGGGGDNSLNVSATGGSVGSAAGDGGLVSVNAGRNLTVNNAPGSLNSNPLGLNGKGANITLSSGNLAGGDLFVNMPFDASGIGTGGGGSISLTTNSATTFNIGTGSVNPGVNGALTANGGAGAGAGGGTIAVVNKGAGGINIGATTNISTQASAAGAWWSNNA